MILVSKKKILKRSSYKGLTVDTLAHRGEEGRGYRRNASGSWKQALIRRCPNGATQVNYPLNKIGGREQT